ncbi:hypothetical protein FRB97_004477, partial [Tulasnella sp. 331]
MQSDMLLKKTQNAIRAMGNRTIVRGTLQIAISDTGSLWSLNWKHWECMSKKQGKKIRRIFNSWNVETLRGYTELASEDKARVNAMLGIKISKEDIKKELGAHDIPENPNSDYTLPRKPWTNVGDDKARPRFTKESTERQGPWSRSRAIPLEGMSPEELKALGNLNY